MARIRQYQQQVSPSGQLSTNASAGAFGAQVGQALSQAGQGLGRVSQQMQERRERTAQLENERILSEQRLHWQQRFQEMQQEAEPGAPEFTDQFLNEFRDSTSQLVDERPTRASREHLSQNLLRLQDQFAGEAISFQAQAAANHEIQQVEETIQNEVNAVRADPTLIDNVLEDVDRLTSELPVDEQRRSRFRQENRPNVGMASIMGQLDQVEAASEAQVIEQELTETDRWKNLLTTSQYDQALNRSRQLQESLASQQQQEYREGFQEQKRQWEQGNQLDSGRFSSEEIEQHVQDPELAQDMVYEAAHSKRVGRQSVWVRSASPEAISQRMQALSQQAASPIERTGEFDEATQELTALQEAVEQRQRALENDRAGYVRNTSERVNRLYSDFAESPSSETMDAYVAATRSEQQRLGIPSDQVRLLPNEYAAEIGNRLQLVDRTPEGAENVYRQLRSLHQEFGRHWPTVQRQLEEQEIVDGPLAVAAGMTEPMEARSAQDLIQASVIGRSQMKEQVDRTGLETDLSEAVNDTMADFQNTIRDEVGGARVFSNYRESVELLALRHMTRGEQNVGRAVDRAFEETLGQRYDFTGTFRVPKETPQSTQTIEQGALRFRLSVDQLPLVTPESSVPGITEEATQEAWSAVIRSEGYWTTNGDETGLQLVDPNGDVVLMRKNGREVPVEFTWEQFASAPETVLGPIPPSELSEEFFENLPQGGGQ